MMVRTSDVNQDYKRGSIEQRPSFYNNHVSAIVRKSYSEKAFIVEPANRSKTGGRIEGTESTAVTLYTTGKRKGTEESDFGLLQD